MKMKLIHGAFAVLLVLVALPAAAEFDFSEGRWRLELTGGTGIHSGSTDRGGDVLLHFNAEYEIPATKRLALGLRLMPGLVYFQDDQEDDHWHHFHDDDHIEGDGDTVFGAGAGIALRLYTKPQEYRGLFFEIAGVGFGHSGEFNGNSSNFNFITSGGIGYKFKSDFHTVLKVEHISNAGIGEDNRGANSVGLGFGFTF